MTTSALDIKIGEVVIEIPNVTGLATTAIINKRISKVKFLMLVC